MLLNNYHLLLPEIYLTLIITFLLGFGLFFIKLGSKYNLLNKFLFLNLLTFVWTFILIFNNSYGSISDIFIFNSFNSFIKEILLISTFILLLISSKYFSLYKISDFEFPILISISLLGFFLLVSSNNLLVMYLSIETISLSLYILAGIKKNNSLSTEAGLKYFILGALSSGLLLFGCSLIYFSTGLIDFPSLGHLLSYSPISQTLSSDLNHSFSDISLLELGPNIDSSLSTIISEVPRSFSSRTGQEGGSQEIGAIFIIISLLFKIAAAPFHMWAPDVYEGSPTIVTFYFSTVPKIAILYILYVLLYGPFYGLFTSEYTGVFDNNSGSSLQVLLLVSGLLSIGIGTFGAIYQNRIIRLIAFSAIAHVGFILLGFSTGTFISVYSSFIYILVYIIMSFNTFTFVLSVFPEKKYLGDLLSYYKLNPVLGITFTFSLLSIAGIPPLAGFFSKFYILFSLIDNGFYIISLIAIVLSVIASYYYIRIIQWMYFNKSSLFNFYYTISSLRSSPGLIQSIILGSTTYFILTFLLFPKPLLLLTFDLFY